MPLLRDADHLTKRGIVYVGMACNMRCKHCYVYSEPKKRKWRDLAWVIARILIIRLCRQECLDITGGEPTIHPKLGFLVWLGMALGFKEVRIVTNGTKAEVVRPLVARYSRLRLSVSCHSHLAEELADIGNSKRYPELLFAFIREFNSRINYVNICPTSCNHDFENTPLEVYNLIPGIICIKMMDFNRPSGIEVLPDYAAINKGVRKLLDTYPKARVDFRYFEFCEIDKDLRDHPRVNMCSVRNNVYDPHDWVPLISWITTLRYPIEWIRYIFGTKKMREAASVKIAPPVADRGCTYVSRCEKCIYKNRQCDGKNLGAIEVFGDVNKGPVLA